MSAVSARFRRFPATVASAGRLLVQRKGPLFLVNHLVFAALAAWLLWRIAHWDGSFERRYEIVRLFALGCVAIFSYLSFVLGRRGNARLLPYLAVTCVAAEILMRALGSFGVGAKNDRAWREPRPYFMFGGPSDGRTLALLPQMDDGGGRSIRLNSEGFRIEREIVNPKPADEFRVFVLGGSTVALGKPIEATIPAVIEAHLQAIGLPQARVYNFGVVSFVSGQELALLVHRLIDLKPDLVVAYDGGNDLIQPWAYDPRPGYPFNFLTEEEAMSTLANSQGDAKTIASLARDSAVIQALLGTADWIDRVGATMARLRAEVNYGSEPWKEQVANAYARNQTAMCRVARASGALFASVFQPILAYSEPLDSGHLGATGGEKTVASLREQREMALQAIARQFPAPSTEAGCRFSDFSRILEKQQDAYADAIHIDNESNEMIGGRIAEDLIAWPALKSAPDPGSPGASPARAAK